MRLNFEIREIFLGICVEYFYFNRKRGKRLLLKRSFTKECKKSKQFYTNILQPFEFLLTKSFVYSFAVKKIEFGLTSEIFDFKKRLIFKNWFFFQDQSGSLSFKAFSFNRKRGKRLLLKRSFSKECKKSKQFYTNILQPFEFLLTKTFAYSFAVKK